jgi:hypothetical protein
MTTNSTPHPQNTIEKKYREGFERDGRQSNTGAPQVG